MKDIIRKPTRITPSKVVYEDGNSVPRWGDIFISSAQTSQEWIRSVIILSLLLIVSTAIGAYVYRIINLEDYRLEQIMIAVFRTRAPRSVVFEAGFISSLIFLLINFRKSFDKNYNSPIPGFVRTSAGAVLLIWFDLLRLEFSPFRILQGSETFFTKGTTEIVIAQFTAALLIGILLPLSSRMVNINLKLLDLNSFPRINTSWIWFRYLFAVCAISYFVVFITAEGVPSNLLRPIPEGIFPFSTSWMKLNIIETSALFATLAIAAIFYRLPSSRSMRSFGVIRLVIFLSSVLVCGYIFQNIPVINGYVDALGVAAIIAFSGIPVQRLLS